MPRNVMPPSTCHLDGGVLATIIAREEWGEADDPYDSSFRFSQVRLNYLIRARKPFALLSQLYSYLRDQEKAPCGSSYLYTAWPNLVSPKCIPLEIYPLHAVFTILASQHEDCVRSNALSFDSYHTDLGLGCGLTTPRTRFGGATTIRLF